MGSWARWFVSLFILTFMVVGGWYVFSLVRTGNLKGEEVRLTLRFQDAHGVPVGGVVRHKGVKVGEVLKVNIPPDDSGVIMETAVSEAYLHTLRKSSRFWIVHPRFGGISEGAFGLDTLIKDPYVEYDTPELDSPLLPSGSVIFGLNLPPVAEESPLYRMENTHSSRLTFKVRFSKTDGLQEGATVLYRDLPVGTVLKVDLSLDGRMVEVEVSILGRYRQTVREDSLFWVARPNVEFGFFWPTLVNVRDLSKVITGPALAYATPTESQSQPLKNGDVLEGAKEPPDDEKDFQGPLVSIEPEEGKGWPEGFAMEYDLVGVSFAFTEEDLLRDKRYFFQGTGLLFESSPGKVHVLTARTLADGSYSSSDWAGDPEIIDTDLKILLSQGRVLEAKRVWIDPKGRDLALLDLPGHPPLAARNRPKFSEEGTTLDYYMLVAFREGSARIRTQPIPSDKVAKGEKEVRLFQDELNLGLQEWLGALLLDREGRIVGIVGREEALSDQPAAIEIKVLPVPEKLR